MRPNVSLFSICIDAQLVVPETGEAPERRKRKKQAHAADVGEPPPPCVAQTQINDEDVGDLETLPAEEAEGELVKPALITHIDNRLADCRTRRPCRHRIHRCGDGGANTNARRSSTVMSGSRCGTSQSGQRNR